MTTLDLNGRLTKKSLVTASLISSLLLQAACGGGGGGSGSTGSGDDNSTQPSTTVTGTAAKGLLLDAIVTFYPIVNGEVGNTPLATARTNATNGSFSSPVSASGAVVAVITVDSSTRMLDELTGAPIAAPADLVLRAAFPGLTNLQPLAVTPLTELAYARAASSTGGLTASNISAANDAVGTAFLGGASILQTLPIDVANYASATPAQQAQAKLLTAISVAADQNIATGADGSLCAGTYPENVPCVVQGLSQLVGVSPNGTATFTADAGYLTAAYEAINSGAVNVGGKTPAELGMNVPTASETEMVQNIRDQNPLPGYNPSADPLVNTKDLIANIRTNIVQHGAIESFGFSETLDRLSDDFEDNVEPVANMTVELLPTVYDCALALSGEADGSNCHLTADTSAEETIYGDYDSKYESLDEYGSHRYSSVERVVQVLIAKTGATEYSVSTTPFVRTQSHTVMCTDYYPSQCTPFDESNETAAGPTLTATFTLTKAGEAHSATFAGPFYVNAEGGHVTANIQAAQSSDWSDDALSGSFTISGSLTNGGGGVSLKSATLGASTIHVRNGNTDLFYPEETYSYGEYSWTERVGPPRTIAGNPAMAVWGALDLGQWVTEGFAYSGELTIDEPTYDASNTLGIPGTVKFDASVSEVLPGSVYAPLFKGSLGVNVLGIAGFDATKKIVADNSLTVQLFTNGTLYLPSGRVLSVAATVNADRPTSEDEDGELSWGLVADRPASFSVTYRYSTSQGTAELNASGEYDADGNLNGRITNNAGVTIAIAKPAHGDLSGTITAGGQETATINDEGFVFYTDGTSESVF
jgi:hypothetical protein